MADYTTGGGWTCGRCGVYVHEWDDHFCQGNSWNPPINLGDRQFQILPDLEGLECQLDRIADALENLVAILEDAYPPA